VILDNFADILTFNGCMESVWVLRSGMIAPYVNVADILNGGTCVLGNDAASTVLIKSSKCSEILFRN
jgi:hypothetical protein